MAFYMLFYAQMSEGLPQQTVDELAGLSQFDLAQVILELTDDDLAGLANFDLGRIILALTEEVSDLPSQKSSPSLTFEEEAMEQRRIDYIGWRNFFAEAFEEGRNQPFEGRTINGPHHKDLNTILSVANETLRSIDRTLTAEALMPFQYRDRQVTRKLESMLARNPSGYNALQELREDKREAIFELVSKKMPELASQELPQDLLGVPEFRSQHANRACVSASFLMIMRAITNQDIDDKALEKALFQARRTELVEDEEYLKIFQSKVYRERFPDPVSTASFIGADLGTINTLATGIRNRYPGKQVYCMISLLSKTTEETYKYGVWHSNVLLGADAESVTVHDPAFSAGAERRLSKQDFFDRWGQAYFRGHLIIA